MTRPFKISASVLSANFAYLADDVKAALKAGVDYIHLDVMDRHFVPNLSFGSVICESLRKAGITAPFDAHLMVEKPDLYVDEFAKAGANLFAFHPETTKDPAAVVRAIRASGMQAGLVFNPDRAVEILADIEMELGQILLMSVFPGFSGQSFIPEVMRKIQETRAWIDERQLPIYLAVDGGVKVANAKSIVDAGADFLIVGSGLFNTSNYAETVKAFRSL